jgi:hypothetical protein
MKITSPERKRVVSELLFIVSQQSSGGHTSRFSFMNNKLRHDNGYASFDV